MDKSRFIEKPDGTTCDCIICHEKGVEASDEHIIPKSIGGYLHTWNVCKTCNSIFGDHVDKLLVNQKLVQFERYKYQLKGESNQAVSHPFAGVFPGEDGVQYRIEDEDGVLTPHIIGAKPIKSADGKQISFSIDAKDTKQIRDIVEKFCKRNKLAAPTEWPEEYKVKSEPAPFIKVEFSLNFSELKLAMLKIAYEFTACMIPEYVDDEKARLISGILHEAASDRVDEVEMGNNIIKDEVFPHIFGDYIDFTNEKRHYILLVNAEGKLLCHVKLFNLFCLSVVMADREYEVIEEPIIVINDFGIHGFELFSLSELVNKTSVSTRRGYKLVGPINSQLSTMADQVGFHCDRRQRNYCYDLAGGIIGTDLDIIEKAPDDIVDTKVVDNIVQSIYHAGGQICFLLLPFNVLVPIDEIIIETEIAKY